MATKMFKFGYSKIVQANDIFSACIKFMKKCERDGVKADRFQLIYVFNPNYSEDKTWTNKPGFNVTFYSSEDKYITNEIVEEVNADSDIIEL